VSITDAPHGDGFEVPVGQVEARSVAFSDLDVTKNGRRFDGYAAIYGEESDLNKKSGGAMPFTEVILPPAFRNALASTENLPMLWDHNAAMPPFATTKAGTLKVEEDRRGLRVQAEIDERHILGPTLMSMAERGEVVGMSIGFVTGRKDNKLSYRNGQAYRAITGFKRLLDVSPTWNPAYAGTTAEMRSLTTLGAVALIPEQLHDGEPQSAVDGPGIQEDAAEAVCETCEQDVCACDTPPQDQDAREDDGASEKRDAGAAEDWESAAAARRRRLQMMGLSLPRDLRS
jgi:HK97 family phage prohead protease